MRKLEKTYKVKNLRTGEIFITSTIYEKEIDGELFIGVWKDNDSKKRINWMRKNSVSKISNQ